MVVKKRKALKRALVISVLLFLAMNVVAYFHARKFTHFAAHNTEKTLSPEKLSLSAKIATLLFGINNPKPVNDKFPSQKFSTITLKSNRQIECWYIKCADSLHSKGTIAIFHGYSGQKSSMLDKSDEFLKMGYNTLLVDFMGSGGSEGYQTTLGFQEAEQVKTVYEYLQTRGEKNIYLFGTSMGAAAILKSISDYGLNPIGIIIECPFGSMYQTTCARFRIMGVPTFPMAALLVFWGGVQNGFWAFGHNPSKYATSVNCPTLLLYGGYDLNVSRQETDEIYKNIKGPKTLRIYPQAAHENYLLKYRNEWISDIDLFLKNTSNE